MIVLKNTKLMPITKVKNITKNFDLGKFLHLVFSHALNRAAGDLGVMKGNLGVPFIYGPAKHGVFTNSVAWRLIFFIGMKRDLVEITKIDKNLAYNESEALVTAYNTIADKYPIFIQQQHG